MIAGPLGAQIEARGEIETDKVCDCSRDTVWNLSYDNRDDEGELRVHLRTTLADEDYS